MAAASHHSLVEILQIFQRLSTETYSTRRRCKSRASRSLCHVPDALNHSTLEIMVANAETYRCSLFPL